MAEYPPLGKSFVLSYSNNDRNYPIVAIRKDPRVDNYKIPEDLSPHPDTKRWPNHVFTGAQPTNSDERVHWIYEILPSPWVPFTRYDDDLGPVQGRRRSVKNEGQVASLTADKRTTYEAREGSSIVYTEMEETWSIKVDEDGNSLFPIRDRDFYEPSRGPVQERRQLFVPTGEEQGSLENVNGVITQTSYEPYNEFLSVKIVQTYKVNGPQLISKATDNEGQLVTITTQRKAADGYVPLTPTATRTVEANREDAESLIERIVDTPEVFGAEVYRKTKEDLTPQKFRGSQIDFTVEKNQAGKSTPDITLNSGEFSKSEQQVNKFVKRVSTTSRNIANSVTLNESILTDNGQIGTRTLTLNSGPQSFTPSAKLLDASVEDIGDGRTVKTEVRVPKIFDSLAKTATKPDTIPEKFRANAPIVRVEEVVEKNNAEDPTLGENEYSKTEQRITEFTVQKITTARGNILNETDNQRLEENWGIQIPYKEYISGSIPSGDNYEGEGLDDKYHLVREYDKNELNSTLSSFNVAIPTSIDLDLPRVLKSVNINWQTSESSASNQSENPSISGQFKSLTQQDGGRISSTLSISPSVSVEFEDIWGKNLPATIHLFFLKKDQLNNSQIRSKIGATGDWPVFKPKSFYTTIFGKTETKTIEASISRSIQINDTAAGYGYVPSKNSSEFSNVELNPVSINIPPCLTEQIKISETKKLTAKPLNIQIAYEALSLNAASGPAQLGAVLINLPLEHSLECKAEFTIPATTETDVPKSGTYLISSSAEPYKFGWFLIRAISLDAGVLGQ